MLSSTRGIVLHSTLYSDRFSITLVFTEEFGRVSYLTARTTKGKSRAPKSLFHPLATLELVVEHFPLREVHRIKEAKSHIPLVSMTCDPVKNAIALFIAELIGKTVREEHPNRELFDYFLQSIKILELTTKSCANFHIAFMIGLSRYLGFYPDVSEYVSGAYFDLLNGHFVSAKPQHHNFLNPDDSLVFSRLMRITYENMTAFRFSGSERKAVIEHILNYYRLHLTNFSEIKSVAVLHEVFS